MTFTASNSRILVTAGSPAETIFDTDENMPHIVGTAYIYPVTVAFPNVANTTAYHETLSFPATGENYTPGFFFSETVMTAAAFTYTTYSYNYFFETLESTTTYTAAVYEYNTSYTAAVTTYFTYYVAVDYYQYHLSATEYDATVDIANLPTDEDGAFMDIDFIVVLATGSATVKGTDPVTDQALATTLPSGVFSFQGSALLEAAGRVDGSSWLRRIISLEANNTTKKLTLRSMSSVATVPSGDTYEAGTAGAAPASIASTFSMGIQIFFGRFKS